MKTTRIPHAPRTPLPELAEFLAPFRVHFHRSEATHAVERYLTGLSPNTPTKTATPSPQSYRDLRAVPPGPADAMDWDEDDLDQQRVQDMLTPAHRGRWP